MRQISPKVPLSTCFGFSLEHPQGVGIVGTVGIVGIVGIEFCQPEPRPTTPSILVDILCYSYLKDKIPEMDCKMVVGDLEMGA